MAVFSHRKGNGPLLISMPHDGTVIPTSIAEVMTEAGRAVADTDWHVSRLYKDILDPESSVLCANFSRYVVDLNRPADGAALYPGQDETGLCPVTTFAGKPIYQTGSEPDAAAIKSRLERYWQPYHQRLQATLDEIRNRHGFALLWDAHSIRSEVPRFFDGQLPDFNLGTVDGKTCPDTVLDSMRALIVDDGQFSVVANARFKGGFITRHYGDPERNVFAVQLELAQSTYMDEGDSHAYLPRLATTVKPLLGALLGRFQAAFG